MSLIRLYRKGANHLLHKFANNGMKMAGLYLAVFVNSIHLQLWSERPYSRPPHNEKPQGETVNYDKLIQAWREGRVK
jgi:hypothetical protein